jgi:hypothetical protein
MENYIITNHNTKRVLLGLLSLFLAITSCKKYLVIDPPVGSLEQSVVFKNNEQATSAVNGIYSSLTSQGFASGTINSITAEAGLSADELVGYNQYLAFYENQLSADYSNFPPDPYLDMYRSIYRCNAVLEGLTTSDGVSPLVKAQLQGEAYFIRAFTYFYLVNLFGPVPLQLSTDYRVTQSAPRSTVDLVYNQVLSDLKTAEGLLTDTYPTTGRVRPNKVAVQAMLARTFLYLKDWENAEKYSSLVIARSSIYNLVGYDAIFLIDSKEAIWQLAPQAGRNAPDGNTLIPTSLTVPPPTLSLSSNFVLNAFEPGDKRLTSWVKSFVAAGTTYYYPFKYKIQTATTATEYSTILRLGEQYLIRAEARINKGDVSNGITDINQIRQRPVNGVNVNTIPALSTALIKETALIAVEKERRLELFSEWGHRWFDLKRTGRADDVLSVSKPFWQPSDKLYPIPVTEINRNVNIKQNEGY